MLLDLREAIEEVSGEAGVIDWGYCRKTRVKRKYEVCKYSEPTGIRSAHPKELRRAGFSRCGKIQPLYLINHTYLSCDTDDVCLRTRVHDAPDEENGTRLNIANQEDEGVVYGDLQGRWRYCC
jgi:hypothetical protein